MQIGQQWRIVTSYTEEYIAENEVQSIDVIEKPHPLMFKEEQHKMLNSELKLLYTAVTRARSKLWIFDASDSKRAPMFHYFTKRNLVEYLSCKPDEVVGAPVASFASKSSKKQWKKQGDYFKNKGLWNLAVICYNKADVPLLSKDALGHYYVQLAAKQKHHYLAAANYFCECLMLQQSAKYLEKIASCLYNAQLYEHAAELFAKMKVYILS